MKKVISFAILFYQLFHAGSCLGQPAEDSAGMYRQYFFSTLHRDSLSISEIPELVKGIKAVNFLSGNIYLSGAGFTVVVSTLLSSSEAILRYLPKFKKGSRITIEKGRFKPNDSDKLLLVEKAYIIGGQ